TRRPETLQLARQAFEAAEARNPDSVRVLLIGGLLNQRMGRYEQALEDYRRVQELEPLNADAFLRMADVYDAMDVPDLAIRAYRRAIELEPGYYAPYQLLGISYYSRGQYEQAAAQFRNAIERGPGVVQAYVNLRAALDQLGRDSEAEKALLQSLKIKETAGALNSLGAIRAFQMRDGEAASLYERAAELDPTRYVILVNLGEVYRRTGRLREAGSTFRR